MLTLEEEVTRLVADVDWSDECEVVLHVRKRTMRLTPRQARRIADALTRSADEAERAAGEAVRPVAPARFDMVGTLPPRMVQQVEEIAAEMNATLIPLEMISPDCREGKHPAGWIDTAWDVEADAEVLCKCPCHDTTEGSAA